MLIADAHCDTLTEITRKKCGLYENDCHIDIQKLLFAKDIKRIQIFAAFCGQNAGEEKNFILRQIDKFRYEIKKNEKWIVDGATGDKKPVTGFLSVEGLNFLNPEEKKEQIFLDYLLDVVIMIGPSWNLSGSICSSCMDDDDRGLSVYGKQVIQKMEKRGVLLDISHMSQKSVEDALEDYCAPIVASHSNAQKICGHCRNLTDRQIRRIARSEGLIGINFCPLFLTQSKREVSVEDVVRHIEYIAGLAGEGVIGIGTDFDGIEDTPYGLENTALLYRLPDALLKRNYSEQAVAKIMGENMERLISRVLERKGGKQGE